MARPPVQQPEVTDVDGISREGCKRYQHPAYGMVSASRISGNAGYVAKQFDEHMETTKENAKSEINAYALHMRIGGAEQALPSADSFVLELPASHVHESEGKTTGAPE